SLDVSPRRTDGTALWKSVRGHHSGSCRTCFSYCISAGIRRRPVPEEDVRRSASAGRGSSNDKREVDATGQARSGRTAAPAYGCCGGRKQAKHFISKNEPGPRAIAWTVFLCDRSNAGHYGPSARITTTAAYGGGGFPVTGRLAVSKGGRDCNR